MNLLSRKNVLCCVRNIYINIFFVSCSFSGPPGNIIHERNMA